VKSLGADTVIDYKTQKFEEVVHDFDAAFDTIGGDTYVRSFKVLKKGGRHLLPFRNFHMWAGAAHHGLRGLYKEFAPWRFIVFEGEARRLAGAGIAAAFRAKYPDAKPEHVEAERERLARAPCSPPVPPP
jgi:hypothetical protein